MLALPIVLDCSSAGPLSAGCLISLYASCVLSETTMESGIHFNVPFREKVTEELREFSVLTVNLYVCFAALLYMKAAILQAEGIAYAPFGTAITKAAICAKFMLLGRAINLGEHFKRHVLIIQALHMAFFFLLLLIALTVIEEAVVGVIHGRRILESIAGIAGGTFHQMIATSLIMLLILIYYFAFQSLGDLIGNKLLFGCSSNGTALNIRGQATAVRYRERCNSPCLDG
jgi:hypothetical protein